MGFVFGYVHSRLFYLVSWKAGDQTFMNKKPFKAIAKAGLSLKLVKSQTGPGEYLRNSLWHDASVKGQTKRLWRDREHKPWKFYTAYRWRLLHRPEIGLIRIRVFKGKRLEVDSGNLFNHDIKGGRLGFYCFSQAFLTFSSLSYHCKGKTQFTFLSTTELITSTFADDIPRDVYAQLNLTTEQVQKVTVSEENWLV